LAAAAAGFGHLGDFRYHEVERAKMVKQRWDWRIGEKVEKQGFRTDQLRGLPLFSKGICNGFPRPRNT